MTEPLYTPTTVPLPVVIGVTGHCNIDSESADAVRCKVAAVLACFQARFGDSLYVMTGLADGADQLVHLEAKRLGIHRIAVLPLCHDRYVKEIADRTGFDECWHDEDLLRLELPSPESAGSDGDAHYLDRHYEQLGAFLVNRSHLLLALWEGLTRGLEVPPYVLPGPSAILAALVEDRVLLASSLLVTLNIALLALLLAVSLGGLLAVAFAQSRLVERALFPYAVILQVTPIVAIAPLILIWVDSVTVALLICAWIVAFFPILSNTVLGLNSADRNLLDLFRLYGATRWQTLLLLRLPAALPYFLAGLRIAGGLALIGAVVAEFVAGAGGTGSGLAFRILEAGYQLKVPRMFAALALISASGIAIFAALGAVQHVLLRRWHESSLPAER